MKDKETLDKIEIPFEDFNSVVNENSKILFSGVFGSGKTTFLKDFFNDNTNYSGIHIYPVNYSTVSNQDIFELIKYDILFQLIGIVPKEEFEKLDIPYQLTLWTYLLSFKDLEKKGDFFASFLNFIPKFGSTGLKIYQQIKSLIKGYEDFYEQIQKDDFLCIKKYLEDATTKKGHLYEEDFFTELIRVLLSKVKKDEGKEVVLVIDDLDRLDPDHLFRILNVFSAHNDFAGAEGDNKFDFDKVVFVCDYNNIENVFSHKYGVNSDFKGYIDKFYTGIYWYSISKLVKEIIGKYLGEIKTGIDDFFSVDRRIGIHIRFILLQLIDYDLINLRDLVNYNKTYDLNYFSRVKLQNQRQENVYLQRYNINIESVLNFFISFFNNNNEFLKTLNKASKKEFHFNYDSYDKSNLNKICEIIWLMDIIKFSGRTSEDDKTSIRLSLDDLNFECDIIKNNYSRALDCKNVTRNGHVNKVEKEKIRLNYFSILEEGTKAYLDYLK